MSVSLDSSVNALLGQSQAMSQIAMRSALQAQLVKGVHDLQESAVMTLISSVGLTTYDQSGALKTSAPSGMRVQAIG
jgi:hypothetical protein